MSEKGFVAYPFALGKKTSVGDVFETFLLWLLTFIVHAFSNRSLILVKYSFGLAISSFQLFSDSLV